MQWECIDKEAVAGDIEVLLGEIAYLFSYKAVQELEEVFLVMKQFRCCTFVYEQLHSECTAQ